MISIYSSSTPPLFYQQSIDYTLPPYTGVVQWNGAVKRLEVSTGTGWTALDTNIRITTSHEVEEVLKWARKKMIEEQQLLAMADKYPAVSDLKEKLDIVMTLLKDEVKE